MKRKLLSLLLVISVMLPMACTKPVAGREEPGSAVSNPDVQTEIKDEDLKLTEGFSGNTDNSEDLSEAEDQKDNSENVEASFSESTVGQVLTLMNDCNGKDLDDAVKTVEGFFGTELVGSSSYSQTENDVTTHNIVFFTQICKDELRFNRITFACNEDDGTVCGVELSIRNDEGANAYAPLDPVPDFSEVNDMYISFTDEVSSVCGEAFQSGNLHADDDSYWTEYKYGKDCIIRLELYNYSGEDENGLIAGKYFFKNNSYN